jgi:CDP-paratose 2-epimerase
MKISIVTGSNGLIGSQTVKFLIGKGYKVYGIDNDMRSYFFGDEASTKDSEASMKAEYGNLYEVLNVDIRDYAHMYILFDQIASEGDLDLIVHTAAQPSHDWAANEPLTDFTVNAVGTMNLLEATRLHCPKATFIFTSTNKVYGDRPNWSYETGIPDSDYFGLNIVEEENRYEGYFVFDEQLASIGEKFSIDACKHSIFGASKVAADVMVQEYGKYFGMNTVVFRGGCLTGPNHAGAELHGFLSYLIKCIVNDKQYSIFGYKGKQVRDNIHSWDLVNMFWHYHQNPKPGAIYNAGGGRENSTSILEAIDTTNEILRDLIIDYKDWNNYTIKEENRIGDHIWYISDLTKFQTDYPEWPGITISLKETIKQIALFEISKTSKKM